MFFFFFFEFQRRFDIQTNFLQYYGLCNAIRSGFKMTTHVAPSKALEPIIPEAVHLVMKTNVGCSHIYQSFLKNKVKECKALTKWNSFLDLQDVLSISNSISVNNRY